MNLPWVWDKICINPNLKFSDITSKPDLPWNKIILSKHSNLSFKEIIYLFNLEDYDNIKDEKNIFSKKYIDNISIDAWDNISLNNNISWNHVKNISGLWNYKNISLNNMHQSKLRYINTRLREYSQIIFKYQNRNLPDDILNNILSYFYF